MNRTALITGASRGIGRAAAELLAERGYRLMLNYFRSEGSVQELKQKLTAAGADAEIFQADVATLVRRRLWRRPAASGLVGWMS